MHTCAHTHAHACMLAHTYTLTIHTRMHAHMHAPSGSAHFSKGSQEANSTCQVQQQLEQQLTTEPELDLGGGWLSGSSAWVLRKHTLLQQGKVSSTQAGGRFLNKMVRQSQGQSTHKHTPFSVQHLSSSQVLSVDRLRQEVLAVQVAIYPKSS